MGTLPKISFTRAIPDKLVVETHLTVQAILADGRVKKVKGAWGWMSDRSAVFRPIKYWPGNATITVTSTLDRAVMGKSGSKYVVGSRDLATTWTFRTARKFIAKVDGQKVNMRVWIDGKKVRTIPVSLGKDEWETRNGVKVISTQKEPTHTYLSTSLNLGPEEEYELEAPWNTRLTPTGEFIHTATWAYGRIGRYNGSHGCTNMYEADAKWIYDKTIPGDVVLYENTGGDDRAVLERRRRTVEHPVGPVAQEVGARQRRHGRHVRRDVGQRRAGSQRLRGGRHDPVRRRHARSSRTADGEFSWTVPDGWQQGRGAWGGLVSQRSSAPSSRRSPILSERCARSASR